MDITQLPDELKRAIVLFTANWLSEYHRDKEAEFRVLFNQIYVSTMDAGTKMLMDFYDGKRKTKPSELATAKAQMAQEEGGSESLINDYFNDRHKEEWLSAISQPNSLQKYLT